jgi:hypothetical protein
MLGGVHELEDFVDCVDVGLELSAAVHDFSRG